MPLWFPWRQNKFWFYLQTRVWFSSGQVANIASDEKDFRVALDADFGLKADSLASRVKISKLLSSWATVKMRSEKLQSITAENKASDLPRPVVSSDFNSMLSAVEKLWDGGKLPSALRPSKSYFASKFDELEDNDYAAEQLDVVTSRAVGEDSSMDLNESIVHGARRLTKCSSEANNLFSDGAILAFSAA